MVANTGVCTHNTALKTPTTTSVNISLNNICIRQ